MIKYLSKFLYILAGKPTSLFILIFSFISTSILEAFGIGLIGPFMKLASEPDFIYRNSWLNWVYTQSTIDSISKFISLLGLGIIIVFLMKSYLYFSAQAYVYRFSYTERGKLASRLLNAYITAPYTFHINTNTASLIQLIIDHTQRFSNGCLIPLLNLIANCTVVCVLLLLLFKTSLILVICILGVLLPIFIFYYRLKDKVVKWGKDTSEANTEVIRIIKHGLEGLKETRIIGCEDYFEVQMSEQVKKFANAFSSYQISQFLPRITIEIIIISFLIIFASISLTFFEEKAENITAVLSVFAIAGIRLVPSVSQCLQSINQIQNNSHVIDQLYLSLKEIEEEKRKEYKYFVSENTPIKNYVGEIDSKKSQIIKFTNKFVLNKISYTYPNTNDSAIENINLTINKGQSVAFIGKSGAGKTTLADIILGLLVPQKGDIIIDGVSVYSNLRAWQNLIGYIPQSIFLMDETIEKNIAFGVPDHLIDSDRLKKAIEAAQLTEVIKELPDGVKTSVGEKGVRLSGGQRQRIGIARALYHDREILILDEATSALDNNTESLVSDAIKSLAGKKTLIIIAHRLSTIQHCDCIYLMEKGRVIKSGKYQEVI